MIFICYRSADSGWAASTIFEHLRASYGSDKVFLDTSIEPAQQWERTIQDHLIECRVFLLLIGNQWLTLNNNGIRRVDDPEDFVRKEIETALTLSKLSGQISIIPVLVDGASIPIPKELPQSIRKIIEIQAIQISQRSHFNDIRALKKVIDKEYPELLDRLEARQRSARIVLSQNDQALGYDNFYRFLAWKYNTEKILRRVGREYPTAILPIAEQQMYDVNSILGEFREERTNDYNIEDLTYRDTVSILNTAPMLNRQMYRIVNIVNQDSAIQVNCKLGLFFDVFGTSRCLEWELLQQWYLQTPKPTSEEEFRDFNATKLTLRNKLEALTDRDPIRNGHGRCSAMGVAMLIAFHDDKGKLRLWMKRRSDKVAVNPLQFHVIPSGMFQPVSFTPETEFMKGGVKATLYREYLEEVFNRKEPDGYQDKWDYFYDDPRLKILQSFIDKGDAHLLVTGIAIDLISLGTDICSLLYIKSPEWFRTHKYAEDSFMKFQINDEYFVEPEIADTVSSRVIIQSNRYEGSIEYSDSDTELIKYGFYPGRIAPTGAAAFWLGVDAIRYLRK